MWLEQGEQRRWGMGDGEARLVTEETLALTLSGMGSHRRVCTDQGHGPTYT